MTNVLSTDSSDLNQPVSLPIQGNENSVVYYVGTVEKESEEHEDFSWIATQSTFCACGRKATLEERLAFHRN